MRSLRRSGALRPGALRPGLRSGALRPGLRSGLLRTASLPVVPVPPVLLR
jgi:hypothetical protein